MSSNWEEVQDPAHQNVPVLGNRRKEEDQLYADNKEIEESTETQSGDEWEEQKVKQETLSSKHFERSCQARVSFKTGGGRQVYKSPGISHPPSTSVIQRKPKTGAPRPSSAQCVKQRSGYNLAPKRVTSKDRVDSTISAVLSRIPGEPYRASVPKPGGSKAQGRQVARPASASVYSPGQAKSQYTSLQPFKGSYSCHH